VLDFDAQGRLWSVSGTEDWDPRDASLRTGKSVDIVQFDLASGQRQTVKIPETRLVSGGTFSPDHKLVAVALHTTPEPALQRGAGFGVWEVATKKLLFEVPTTGFTIGALAFSPDASTLSVGSYDGTLELWDVARGKLLRKLPRAESMVFSTLFLPDGKTLLSGTSGGSINLYDVADGKLIRSFDDDIAVYTLRLSPDGKWLATGGLVEIGNNPIGAKARLWDVQSGRMVQEFALTGRRFSGLDFSPDSKLLALGSFVEKEFRRSRSEVQLWDLATQRQITTLRDVCGMESPLFAPDGKHLLVQSGGWLKLWDLPGAVPALAQP
jgi:WD40 repeat protein